MFLSSPCNIVIVQLLAVEKITKYISLLYTFAHSRKSGRTYLMQYRKKNENVVRGLWNMAAILSQKDILNHMFSIKNKTLAKRNLVLI